MKLKLLALGFTLAFAGTANATLTDVSAATGSSVFLTAWGETSAGEQRTYIRDLGLTLDNFAVNASLNTSGLESAFLDPNYAVSLGGTQTFATFASGLSTVNWTVTTARAGNSPQGQLLTTLSTPNLPANYTNSNYTNISSTVGAWIGQMNPLLGAGSETINIGGSLNNANTPAAWGTQLGGFLGAGRFQNGAGFASGYGDANAVGFFRLLPNTSNTAAIATIKDSSFATQGKWWLASDGAVNYSYAPVPEPGTYALLGAGLLIVGAVVRRRAS